MTTGKHVRALNAAFRAGKTKLTDFNRPLKELCRTLAEQMDEAGPSASTRLTAAYLSALKDLNRVLTAGQPEANRANRLDELKAKRRVRQAG